MSSREIPAATLQSSATTILPADPAEPESIQVEVAHEALIRYWERMQQWLIEDRVGLRLRQEITDAADAWEKSHEQVDYLTHQGGRLVEVEALREAGRLPLNDLEAKYVAACIGVREKEIADVEAQQTKDLRVAQELAQKEVDLRRAEELARAEADQRAQTQRRSAARFRWLSVLLAVLVVLASGSALYAGKKRQEARAERIFAEQQATITHAKSLAASSTILANGGEQDQLAALLGVEAATSGANPGIESEVGTALQASIGAPYFSWLIGDKHDASDSSLALNPGGTQLAVGHFDGNVLLWDLTATPPAPVVLSPAFTEGQNWVSSVAFSRDGRYLAAAAYGGAIQVWDLSGDNPEAITPALNLPRAVYSVLFGTSPSSGDFLLAAGCAELTCARDQLGDSEQADASGNIGTVVVRRWSASSGYREPFPVDITFPGNRIYATAISANGLWLAAGGCRRFPRPPTPEPNVGNGCGAGFLYLQNLEQPTAPPISIDSGIGAVMAVTFAPGEPGVPRLAAAGDDGIIRIWQPDGQQPPTAPIAMLVGSDEEVRSLAFSPAAPLLVSSGHDGNVSLWDLSAPRAVVEVLGSSTEWIRTVAFDDSGHRLASASSHGEVRLWEMTPDHPLAEPGLLRGHTSFIRAIAFGPNPDAPMLASAAEDGTVRIWQLQNGRLNVHTIVIRPGSNGLKVSAIAFSGDGQFLVVADERGAIWKLNLADVSVPPLQIGSHQSGPLVLAYDPKHPIIAAAGASGVVQLWDASADTPHPIGDSLVGAIAQIWAIAYSPDATLLAAGAYDGTIYRWRVAEDGTIAEPLPPLKLADVEIRSLAFGPDNTLVTGDSDGRLCFWGDGATVANETCPMLINGHIGDVRSLAFSPKGDLLASGGIDQTVRLWDPHDPGKLPVVIPTIMEWARALAFSPDGHTLATSSTNGSIRLLLPYTADLVSRACARVGRDLTEDEWRFYMGTEVYRQTCAGRVPNDSLSSSTVQYARHVPQVGLLVPLIVRRRRRRGAHLRPDQEATQQTSRDNARKKRGDAA